MLAVISLLLLQTWPASRYGDSAQILGDKVYIFGGAHTIGRQSNDNIQAVECVDLNTHDMTVPTQMPIPRGMPATAELNGDIYIAGGMDNQNVDTNTLYRYNPTRNDWKKCAPMRAARSRFTLTAHNGKLYAVGAVHERSVEIYDPVNDAWTPGPSIPAALHAHAAADFRGHVTILGGNCPNETNQMLWLDDEAGVWRNGPHMNITRTFFAAFPYHGSLYVIGNHRGSAHPEVLRPGATSWQFLPNPDCPAQRFAAVLYNDMIYVFGSEDRRDPPIWTMRLP